MANPTMMNGFVSTYGVQLLLEKTPKINKSDLLAALRQRCGKVEPLDGSETSDQLSFVYPDHPITYADATVPAQTFMALAESGIEAEKAEPALQQSWDWPEARSIVFRSQSTLLVTDFMSSQLACKTWLGLFQNALSAVLDVVPCLGIQWMPSQRFVSPDAYILSKQAESFDRLFPAVNVRLFDINNGAAGETLMDTIGLAALGVPDLQCHFVGLDVNDMARVLYNSAYYLFDNGDIIDDGQTIQGVSVEDRWRCQHEDALVGPERVVLDLNPGRPFAAGNRR